MMDQALEPCEVRTRLTGKIKVASELVSRLSTHQQTANRLTDYNERIAEARKAGREAVKAFEKHCKEHGCNTSPVAPKGDSEVKHKISALFSKDPRRDD